MKNWDYLLFYRWLTVNLFGVALLWLMYVNGWLGKTFSSDTTGIVYVIAGLFLYGMIMCGYKIFHTSREMNALKKNKPIGKSYTYMEKIKNCHPSHMDNVINAFQLKVYGRIVFIRHISSALVLLGLIGTVVGFIISLQGITPDIVGDVSAIGPMVANLTQGLGIALYTTLLGSVLNIWLTLNYQMLTTGVTNLIAEVIEHATEGDTDDH